MYYNQSNNKYEFKDVATINNTILNDLDDVTITAVQNKDVLVYNNVSAQFENR